MIGRGGTARVGSESNGNYRLSCKLVFEWLENSPLCDRMSRLHHCIYKNYFDAVATVTVGQVQGRLLAIDMKRTQRDMAHESVNILLNE